MAKRLFLLLSFFCSAVFAEPVKYYSFFPQVTGVAQNQPLPNLCNAWLQKVVSAPNQTYSYTLESMTNGVCTLRRSDGAILSNYATHVSTVDPCPTTEAAQASAFSCYMLKGVDVTCGSEGTHSSTPTPPSACDGSCMVATTEVEDCYSIVDGNLYEAVYCRYTGMKTGKNCTAIDKAEATKPPAPTSCPAGYSQGEINGTTTCVKCSTPDCSGGTGGGGTDGGGTDGGGTDGGGTDGGGTDGGGTGGGGTGGGGTDGGGTDGGGTDGGGDGTGGDGDGEEPADNPTPSGSLYTAKGKTLQSVMQAQQAAFSGTGLGRIATTFFTVPNTGASCPTWSAEIPYLSTTLTFDFFCLELVAKILLVVKGVLLVIASYAAFRVAFG